MQGNLIYIIGIIIEYMHKEVADIKCMDQNMDLD